VKGTVSEPLMARRYRPIDPIGFDYRYFRVAPHYRTVYPSLSVYTADPFFFDPYYYSHYYPYWQRVRIELPTREMLRRVLPEGVLAEGGRLEGFLYFERVEETRDARVPEGGLDVSLRQEAPLPGRGVELGAE